MATQNIQVSDELLAELQVKAAAEGKSVDQLAEEALRVGLEAQQDVRDLDELISWGQRHGRERGHKPSDVQRAINEIRRAR